MPKSTKYANLDPYLRHITPGRVDPTYSILKAHLLFEELLRDYLHSELAHPNALNGARLSFAQLLAVSRATAAHVSPDNWHWTAIAELNKLRNLLAHYLEPSALQLKIEEYTQFIVTKSGNPLPTPLGATADDQTATVRPPLYQAVDMVTAGLFMYSASLLRLAPIKLLAKEQSQEQALAATKHE